MSRPITVGLVAILSVGGALVMNAGRLVAQDATPTATDPVKVVRAYAELHASGDYQGDLLAADAVLEGPGGPPVRSASAIAEFLNGFYGPMGDVALTIDKLFASDGDVALVGRVQGSHQGPVLGVPPTGNPIAFPITVIYEVENGEITRVRAFFDLFGLLQQVGAISPPDAPAATPTT